MAATNCKSDRITYASTLKRCHYGNRSDSFPSVIKLTTFDFSHLAARCRHDPGDRQRCGMADDRTRSPAVSGPRQRRRSGSLWPAAVQRKGAACAAVSGVPAPTAAAIVSGQHAGVPAEVSERAVNLLADERFESGNSYFEKTHQPDPCHRFYEYATHTILNDLFNDVNVNDVNDDDVDVRRS